MLENNRLALTALSALAAGLLLSLTIKYWQLDFDDEQDDLRLGRDVAHLLTQQGYRVQVIDRPVHTAIVKAQKGDCRLWLRDATIHGGNQITHYRMSLGEVGPVQFVHDGQWRDAYPSVSIEIAWRLQREAGRLGWAMPVKPVLAVAASPRCRPAASLFAPARIWLNGQ